MAEPHVTTFRRYGRSCQMRIASAGDLRLAAELDEAHWAANGAPVASFHADATFLALLDSDRDGRILCGEVSDAVRWLLATLATTDGVDERRASVRIEDVSRETGDGQRIRQSLGRMLERLGLDAGEALSLDRVREIKAQVESKPVSEAGVVLPAAAESEGVRQFLQDVIAAVGPAEHPSGQPGVGAEQLRGFLTAAAEAVAWHDRGRVPEGVEATDVMPLGDRTPEAYAVLAELRPKLDQYFAQCEALALDERFAARMGWTDGELGETDFDDPSAIERVLRAAPLARARADRTLRLDEPVNPFYAELLGRFRRDVAAGALGESPDAITARQWRDVRAFFAAHQAWAEARPPQAVLALGIDRLRDALDARYAGAVEELIAESRRTAFDLDSIRLTEKLLLYQAGLLDLANNFVSFPHLYDPAGRAMFEEGTLVMDGRRFDLAVRVPDRKLHAEIARTSNMCLLYVEVTPRDGRGAYEVAVPVTSGGIGNLCVHKHGVFQAARGRECDARVVQIIDNPISLLEAVAAPWRRLGRLITGKVESLTAQAEKRLDQQVGGALDRVTSSPPTAATPQRGSTGGMLMGLGVAGAAVGSALAYIASTLSEKPVAVLIGLLGAVLLVALPSSLIAWLKLRRRDLSAILEGSGWGINARMRLTRAQSRTFTRRPAYPRHSRGTRRVPWGWIVAAVILLALLGGGGEWVRRRLRDRSAPPATAPARAPQAPAK